MAGTAEILQEYLVKLGYQTDTISLKKFEDGLSVTGKKVLKVGTAVAAAVVAVEAAAAAFAYSMRKIYFESELSNTSVKNLRALEYAGKQIGITGDAMGSAIHGMAQAMRLNPGLQGLIESFGIKVTGRDTSDVMLDFVGALKNMPEFTAAKYASMFGMDADTYHQMTSHLEELKKKKEEHLAMSQKYGLDLDKQKSTILAYTSALDNLEAKFAVTGQLILSNFADPFGVALRKLNEFVDGLNRLASGKSFFNLEGISFAEVLGFESDKWKAPVKSKASESGRISSGKIQKSTSISVPGRLPGEMTSLPPKKFATATDSASAQSKFTALESTYGLPKGLLDNVWQQESSRGKHMKSPAGAEGHFQFMPATAKQYGVADPYNLDSASTGAAKMYSDLLKKYKGDIKRALAAYNWGQGNVDKYIRGEIKSMPKETQQYVSDVTGRMRLGADGSGGGVNINQTTTINVAGGNPTETAKAVAGAQSRVNGDMTRNFKGAVS